MRHQWGGSGGKRAIIGWSMGGYGALLAAEMRPRLFAAVVAVSPAVWTEHLTGRRIPASSDILRR